MHGFRHCRLHVETGVDFGAIGFIPNRNLVTLVRLTIRSYRMTVAASEPTATRKNFNITPALN